MDRDQRAPDRQLPTGKALGVWRFLGANEHPQMLQGLGGQRLVPSDPLRDGDEPEIRVASRLLHESVPHE
jgi:hypothetical protein